MLDASAVLALLQQEPGEEVVTPFVGRAAWSAVNLCEVAGKLTDRGMPMLEVQEALDGLNLTVHDFDSEMGLAAADLRRTVPRSLSIGDRACLALARRLGLPAVTAEREWKRLEIDGLVVKPIR
ncbi:MAG TPA: type II toxin-antitoxin system VapC family toxin [Candidatus Eisenbacteria bacterium]|nr:type II toxin-antitoxin system VapC family toxin [Candidatus Eisenbacteria bacterium]